MVIKKERPIVMLDWLLRIEVSVYILYQGFIWKFFVGGGGGGEPVQSMGRYSII